MNVIDFPVKAGRRCRVCTITNVEGLTDSDGSPSGWHSDDLCSECADELQEAERRDASRYRYLRNRGLTHPDIAAGGVFAGTVPANKILGGEDLDRAVDAAIGGVTFEGETLEARLADCLAAAIDAPLLAGTDVSVSGPIEIRLGFFRPEIAERAAELLEEAGR